MFCLAVNLERVFVFMEIWKDIVGFEGYYQVSSIGNVRSLDRYVKHNYGGKRFCKGIVLKNILDKDGYHRVNLKVKQKGFSRFVHRLVCEAFIPNPENKAQVNHINGIKGDNRLSNLEWSTIYENRQHAYDTGLQNSYTRRGIRNNFNKLSEEDVILIRKIYKEEIDVTQRDLANKFEISQACVSFIIKRKTWNWL